MTPAEIYLFCISAYSVHLLNTRNYFSDIYYFEYDQLYSFYKLEGRFQVSVVKIYTFLKEETGKSK